MADEHIGDLVVDEMLRRRNLVKDLLHKKYKRTKPLRMEPVKDAEIMDKIENDKQLNDFLGGS